MFFYMEVAVRGATFHWKGFLTPLPFSVSSHPANVTGFIELCHNFSTTEPNPEI